MSALIHHRAASVSIYQNNEGFVSLQQTQLVMMHLTVHTIYESQAPTLDATIANRRTWKLKYSGPPKPIGGLMMQSHLSASSLTVLTRKAVSERSDLCPGVAHKTVTRLSCEQGTQLREDLIIY